MSLKKFVQSLGIRMAFPVISGKKPSPNVVWLAAAAGTKIWKVSALAIFIGVLGVVLSLLPVGQYAEENIGLAWLFEMRGAIRAADEVVVVSLDKASASVLGLNENPEKWSRAFYARIIEKINRQQPALIAFNIFFGEGRDPADDKLLAAKVGEHKNVILSSRLNQALLQTANSLPKGFNSERIIEPLPLLGDAALDTAPFPIPKSDTTVKTFWAYKHGAGDVATLPVIIFQHYVFKRAYPELVTLLKQVDAAHYASWPADYQSFNPVTIVSELQQIQHSLKTSKQIWQLLAQANFAPDKSRLLHAWLALAKAPESLYLNYYGNTGSIKTLPINQILMADTLPPDTFKQKVVLVGYSETIEPEMNQGFYTVYSKAQGQTVSNIELAATAVANLWQQIWIEPLPGHQQMGIFFGWAFLLVGVCWFWSFRYSLFLVLCLGAGYGLAAYFCFVVWHSWLPIAIPLLIQLPLVLLVASVQKYLQDKLAYLNMHKAINLYLPHSVVSNLSQEAGFESLSGPGELIKGVCLATDAGQYTGLCETLNPSILHQLMNRYYSVIFAEVKHHQGIISDVVGDAAVALWTHTTPDDHPKADACRAALAIKMATDIFNQSQEFQLPTRMGLHFGEMRLGNVGAGDHFEYRAVGDTINTANRIENLNKLLGTQILVSANIILTLEGFFSREMGVFILKGKTRPIQVFELLGTQGQVADEVIQLQVAFGKAMALYQDYRWTEALEAFKQLSKVYPQDGPSRFYCQYLQHHLVYFLVQKPTERSLWIDSDFAMDSLLRFNQEYD